MQIDEACSLINTTYVLTQGEKANLVDRLRNNDPIFLPILLKYKATRNVQVFYEELKKNKMLGQGSY